MFTIGTPGAAREVIRLLYAGDRLCAYGDQLLVYSAAGELAEAGGWRYEWKSRRLSSMRTDGKTLTFRCKEQLHDLRDVGDVQAVLRGVGALPADSLILSTRKMEEWHYGKLHM